MTELGDHAAECFGDNETDGSRDQEGDDFRDDAAVLADVLCAAVHSSFFPS